MRKYTVIAVLTIPAGATLGLTHQQAAARSHALETIRKAEKAGTGVYKTLAPVQFKVGEEITTDAELSKAMATSLEAEDVTRKNAADRARAEAEAKDIAALKAKAKQWDDLQPELETLQTKAALFDSLPEAVRTGAVQAAEAAIKAQQGQGK